MDDVIYPDCPTRLDGDPWNLPSQHADSVGPVGQFLAMWVSLPIQKRISPNRSVGCPVGVRPWLLGDTKPHSDNAV